MGNGKVGETLEESPRHSFRPKRTPAHDEIWGRQRDKLDPVLRKAESSPAIQLLTEKIVCAAFLRARKVPDVVLPGMSVVDDGGRQNPKHVIVCCPGIAPRNRQKKPYEAAGGRTNTRKFMSNFGKGLRGVGLDGFMSRRSSLSARFFDFFCWQRKQLVTE